MQNQKNCNCDISGKSASCNQSRCRDDSKRTPGGRVYQRETEAEMRDRTFNDQSDEEFYSDELKDTILPLGLNSLNSTKTLNSRSKNEHRVAMSKDDRFLEENRRAPGRFDPLIIDGKSLTEMSIGGYKIDMESTARKAMEVLPLPAAELPIIFVDSELNFYHHFFQSLKRTIGTTEIEAIANSQKYFNDDEEVILPVIEEFIMNGYDRFDDEMMLFLKRTVISTFECETSSRSLRKSRTLRVVANLWGFKYLEQKMTCDESQLRMWISMCHQHYKILWFNTFKATGIPGFASDGVISSKKEMQYPMVRPVSEDIIQDDGLESHSGRQRRSSSRRHNSSNQSVRTIRRNSDIETQMTRWFAGTR